MPPRTNAIAPTLDTAAMSAPVKARPEPEPEPPVKARPESVAQLAATAAAVDDESPEAPVATIVYDAPGVVPDGIVTLVGPNEPAELAVGVPNVVPCSANVIDSFGWKLIPLTIKEPPGTEHPEVVIPIAFGASAANAAEDHPRLSPKPATAATIARLRVMAHRLPGPLASETRP
jgi:hypothetical protein